MTTLIVALLAVICALLGGVFWRLGDVLAYQRDIRTEVRKLVRLSLNPRTRISQIAPQSGATTEEQVLSRLGRASAARRVVVGGDSDSKLNLDLDRSVGVEEKNDG